MTQQLIRWGVLGTGTIVKKFIAALSILDDAQVYAVASRSLQRAERFAAEYKIPRAYGSYDELARDTQVDVVYIGVPHSFHEECAILCINRGRNVLCEKPFSLDADGTRRMIRAAQENNVFLMEAMWTKYLPTIREVKNELEKGTIGRLLSIDASFGFFTPVQPESRLYDASLGGGALLDVGVYPLALANFFMDRLPDEVSSQAVTGSTGVDEINAIQLVYQAPGGPVLACLHSAIRAAQGSDAFLYGTEGRIWIPSFYQADRAVVYDSQDSSIREISIPHHANGYEYEAMEVMRCLREGRKESAIHSLDHTLETMLLLDQIRSLWSRKEGKCYVDKI